MIHLYLNNTRIGIFSLLWVNIYYPKPYYKAHGDGSYPKAVACPGTFAATFTSILCRDASATPVVSSLWPHALGIVGVSSLQPHALATTPTPVHMPLTHSQYSYGHIPPPHGVKSRRMNFLALSSRSTHGDEGHLWGKGQLIVGYITIIVPPMSGQSISWYWI